MATFAEFTEPFPEIVTVSDPTKLLSVDMSEEDATVVPSYCLVPLTSKGRLLTVKLCVPPVNV